MNEAQELSIGTDPKVADTDGDGLDDGAEYYSRWPVPTKFDLNDAGTECSNPNITESNWDDIKPHCKKINGRWYIMTDPRDTDSDDDGVIDGEDGTSDSDGDGLPNCLDPDSDNDGLRDGTEMGYTLSGYRKIHTGYYDFNSFNDLLPNGEKATLETITSTNTSADWFGGDSEDVDPDDEIPDNAKFEFFDYAEFKAGAPMPNFIADADPPLMRLGSVW